MPVQAGLQTLADRAIDEIEEQVWHRGEVVGTRRRYDTRLFLAHLARLDQAQGDEAAQADAARFDGLVAVIVGGFTSDDLACDDPLLPIDRDSAAERAGEAAGLDAEDAGGSHDYCVAAFRGGLRYGEARWDNWVTGWDAEPPRPGLPGNPLPELLKQALAGPLST